MIRIFFAEMKTSLKLLSTLFGKIKYLMRKIFAEKISVKE
jgi:hypothetical protein